MFVSGNSSNKDDNSIHNGNDNGDCMELEDSEGCVDQPPKAVFSLSSQMATAAIDLDTDSEASDEEEEEPQLQPALSPPHDSQDSEQPGSSGTQGNYPISALRYTFLKILGIQNNEDHIIVKFGGRAGEALPLHPEHVGYAGYSCALGIEDDAINEWAPFSTRVEWEIARWAKLRGPSSTALSELLKITGVSH